MAEKTVSVRKRIKTLINFLKKIYSMVLALTQEKIRDATIITIKQSELLDFLKQARIKEQISTCYVCDKKIKTENVSVVYFRNNKWVFVCDKFECQLKEDLKK